MDNRFFLKLCLVLLLGIVFLTSQVRTHVVVGRDVSNTIEVLESRGKIGDFVSKLRKAKKGDCQDTCDVYRPQGAQPPFGVQLPQEPSQPQEPPGHLEELYNSVPGINTVNVGGHNAWEFKPTQPARYTTSPFYGCTIVVVLDGCGAVIYHIAEVTGRCITMEDGSVFKQQISGYLEDELSMLDFTDQAEAFIVHTSSSNSPGYVEIERLLIGHGVYPQKINEKKYTAGLSTVGHRGKAVIDWSIKDGERGGARLEFYLQSNNPIYVRDYDAEGKPCERIEVDAPADEPEEDSD
ncbi:hypothetical protein FQN54_006409 [Arachnomyces sp. PD_36]|nr:hypothetical protein FQN54_006409 [Arachnomyces sp. PD_36]